ncbi:MAG: ribosome recycling factor [Candidatus Moraniibacteriota bacterium]
MIKEHIESNREHFESAVLHFEEEAGKLRTGRANPALVEGLLVDYYGAKTPLKQIATISTPEARQILIQPWDRGAIVFVETAIRESDLGLNPANDGTAIRVVLPALTEDRRRDLVKALNQRAEDARISVRNTREEIWRQIQEWEKDGSIGEDDKFRGKEDLQKVVDEYNARLESLREKKEKEILTV